MARNYLLDRDALRRGPFPDVLNKEQAALYLGVSLSKFDALMRLPGFPCRKIAGRYFFSRRALLNWIESGDVDDDMTAPEVGSCVASYSAVQYP